jgi:hypothetical protein
MIKDEIEKIPDDYEWDARHDVIWDEGSEAANGASYPPDARQWVSPYAPGTREDETWLKGFRSSYQNSHH